MLPQRAIEERVQKGLEEDERWKIIVRKNNWLCPYCGKIGARELRMDEAIEAKLAQHFQKSCERWQDFVAEPLPIERLRLRAKLIVFKVRVARWIESERRFRMADEERRWLCPYCARETDVIAPESGLEEAPSFGTAPEEHPLVDGIARHLLECSDFARGEDQLRPVHQLEERRALSSGKVRRARIRERFEREPEMRRSGPKGTWLCPYCRTESEVALPRSREPGDEFLDAVHAHFLLCKSSRAREGKPRSADRSREKPEPAAPATRFEKVLAKIKKHASWRARDKEGAWYCPYCAEATTVRFPESRTDPELEAFARKVSDHLATCRSCSPGAATKPKSVLAEAIAHANASLGLHREIREKLQKDKLWSVTDEVDSWACPFCKKVQKAIHIDSAVETSLFDKTVEQVVLHLTRECFAYKPGGEPRVSRGELEKIARPGNSLRSSGVTAARVVRQKARSDDDWARLKKDVEEVRSRVERARSREQSLKEARSKQLRLLPQIPRIPGYELACVYRPCEVVGGDFYDFVRVDESRIGLAIGDVAGHGLEAALLMGLAKKLLEVHGRGRKSVVETLLLANADIFPDLDEKTFVTVFYGILEPKARLLRFSRAGHNPLVVFNPARTPKLQVHDSKGMALGIDSGPIFEESIEELELELLPGDVLVQYTDGVTEAKNASREELGAERLHEVIAEHGHEEAEYLLWKIEKALEAWTGGARLEDDVTLLAVRVLDEPEPAAQPGNGG